MLLMVARERPLQLHRRRAVTGCVRPLIAAFLLFLTACASQPRPLAVALPEGVPSIAYAVAKNGRIVHEGAVGQNATVRTPYPLASVTKPLVATAVMLLAERGTIDLDQPAHRYSALVPKDARYTVRQLLNHTSGLPTYATIRWSGEPSAPHDFAETFRRYGFSAHPPGVVSEYSNLGYSLLGHMIEEQTGESLAAFLKREVFDPLGMRDTTLIASAATPPNAARKHDAAGKPLPDTENDTPGAGNIWSSAHDLVRFGIFHLDDRSSRVLSAASKRTMQTYVEPNALYPYYDSSRYGLGWYFRTTSKGTRVVWHEGGMPGASSLLVLLPDHDLAAAVLINANDRNDVAQTVANQLIASVEPNAEPLTFVPTDGFTPYDAQTAFLGSWQGTLTIDGKPLRCTMTFESGGKITVTYGEHTETFKALVNGDLLLGTFAATLPAEDVMQQPGYVLLRLVRRGDRLSGTMIAYASEEGLRHLYPFPVTLTR
jgi:CubicO group peptidase (beta-lactamase class C family)